MIDEASTVVCVRGTSVSPGLARGPLLLLREGVASGSGRRGSADDEAESLYAAIAAAIAGLAGLMERTDDTDAETILAFQVAMLDDAGVTMLIGWEHATLRGHGEALLDAENGVLVASPDGEARAEFESRQQRAEMARAEGERYLRAPATTADGVRVQVLINVADGSEL